MGRYIGDNTAGWNYLAVRERHSGNGAGFIGENMRCRGMIPNIAPQFANAGFHRQADFVGAHFRHPGIPGNIPDHHGAIMQETHAVQIHPQVTPVRPQNILGLLGHFQRCQHFVYRIAARPQEVGEILFHILRIGVAVHLHGIRLSGAHFIAQFKKRRHRRTGTGHQFLHFISKRLHAEGHDTIVLFISGNQMIRFGNANPVDFIFHP